ncbi:MAG: hypothetical protein J6A01_02785 [Proteobacteria bacterium]|nr:hypothetical protein [Pseudomonadota bacterium]
MSKISPPKANRPRFAVNREGALFIFFLTALGGASIYSGKSGLMILFCCLFAGVVILTAAARMNCMQKLVIERRFVEDIFANRDTKIDILVTNYGNSPVYGIHVYERFEGDRTIGPMFIRKLVPGETATARYLCQFPSRGNAHFCGMEVRSRFPLPFFEWRQTIDSDLSAFVYPEPISGSDQIVMTNTQSDTPARHAKKDDTTIRELVHGRRAGRILWKISAKRQIWLESVPTASRSRSKRSVIQIQSRQNLGAQRYETQISQITFYVLNQMQNNLKGEIVVGNQHVPYGNSQTERREVLEMLAMV